jgi:hypothetical protein
MEFNTIRTLVFVGALGTALLEAVPAFAVDYQLSPLDLGSGFTISGNICTDGTTGPLSAAHVTGWDLVVTQISDIVYQKSNTANLSSQVFSDGSRLLVPTSTDGVNDGGSLFFRGGNYSACRLPTLRESMRWGARRFSWTEVPSMLCHLVNLTT